MSGELPKDEIDQHIIQIVKEKKPENVNQVVRIVKRKFPFSEQQILNRILYLQEKGEIHLKQLQTPTPEKFTRYIRSSRAVWYWITITLTLTTAVLVFTIPENLYPLAYVRHVLGSIFVLWLPGYAFIKALFPEKDLDNIERIALSIGMSLALVPITGLLLNYTPWGIRLTPITLSLLALTTTFATAAIIREHQKTKTKPKQQNRHIKLL